MVVRIAYSLGAAGRGGSSIPFQTFLLCGTNRSCGDSREYSRSQGSKYADEFLLLLSSTWISPSAYLEKCFCDSCAAESEDALSGETMAVYLPVSEKDFSDVTIGEANSALKLQSEGMIFPVVNCDFGKAEQGSVAKKPERKLCREQERRLAAQGVLNCLPYEDEEDR
ncbi:hypothetical protein Bca4012_010795 [Brassica carinata]|uniref:Uncharacterized protein n=1 Tax=Brassica carinata TaxID=52824 RepID=A0A8X7S3N3_BRACI|nr:hypothetical protein Bca52824_035699 [Brassica carinata]